MNHEYFLITQSPPLQGEATLEGAKNAVLVSMASLILTSGKSRLTNIPASDDVCQMGALLESLGAQVTFNFQQKSVEIDTSTLCRYQVSPEIMRKMRASILVMGPLLARFGRVEIALPGGCVLGERALDLHFKFFARMGAEVEASGEFLRAHAPGGLKAQRCVFSYPSVGATENIMMAATLTPGRTQLVYGALEPEVLDLIALLRAMGASISIDNEGTISIEGVAQLQPVEHAIMPDRLEAGTLLLAAAVTRGAITIPDAPARTMEVFLEKLSEMGHDISVGSNGVGVSLRASEYPRAVSFKTMPYPGFPTDLQAPMMVAQCLARGTSMIYETVHDNRILPHVRELQKMGAHITADALSARVQGVSELLGASVVATDIRASAALILAGLVANGRTVVTGLHHVRRGYQNIEEKLQKLGASIVLHRP